MTKKEQFLSWEICEMWNCTCHFCYCQNIEVLLAQLFGAHIGGEARVELYHHDEV